MSKKTSKASQKPKDNYLKKPLIIMGVSLVALIIATITIALLVFNNVINIPFIDDIFVNTGLKEELYVAETSPTNEGNKKPADGTNQPVTDLGENYTPPSFDADEYFEENTSLIKAYSAKASPNVMSESEVWDDFFERGFTLAPYETEYSIDGDVYDLYEISSYSSTKHPVYQTYYESSLGTVWVIYSIDGSVYAMPIITDFDITTDVQVIASETNTIKSYDATLNKFYENIPDSSTTEIITIERIDSENLDLLSGEINS